MTSASDVDVPETIEGRIKNLGRGILAGFILWVEGCLSLNYHETTDGDVLQLTIDEWKRY